MKTAFVLLACMAASAYGAQFGCYLCDNTLPKAQFAECSKKDSDYYGEWEMCNGGGTSNYEDNTCYKAQTDGGVVTRGCPPGKNLNPWDAGQVWESKNRCKKDDAKIKRCTCKDEFCNSGFSLQSSSVMMAVSAVFAVVYSRMA